MARQPAEGFLMKAPHALATGASPTENAHFRDASEAGVIGLLANDLQRIIKPSPEASATSLE